MVLEIFKNLLVYGIIFIIAHLIVYYSLLEKVSEKIKRKEDEKIKELNKEYKKSKDKSFIDFHKKVHKELEFFNNLNDKKLNVFNTGIAIFILLLFGYFIDFFPLFSEVIPIIYFLLVVSGILFIINFFGLLKWNLLNP